MTQVEQVTGARPISRRPGGSVTMLPLVALGFLTRLPAGRFAVDAALLRRSVGAFPAVAVLVGGLGIAVRAGAGLLWSPGLATVAAIATMLAATGALHEDGLADTADGLGTPGRERRLAVMRDPRLGTFGTVALAVVLALRVGLLAPLDVGDFARALLVAQAVAQGGMLLALRGWPALTGSSAEPLEGAPGPLGAALAATTVLVVAVALGGMHGIAAVAAGLVAAAGTAIACRRTVGGLNGDTLGAINQVAHVIALAVMTAGRVPPP